MPLGKYYCDYCDKEFQDTPTARKRHLQSSSHLRVKSLWYKSLNTIPAPAGGGAKGVCNRFINTGFCPYANSCRYLHPSQYNVNPTRGLLGNQLVGGSSFSGDMMRDSVGLPPSLKPPSDGGYPPPPFVDWG